ncbi:sulfotransferase domain-containing protein [Rhodopirellula halodulae]|uniref:sulfotransferase domain-containing protein n=1 Tax=Rhodopirellula halodulae TaxID=2894198 RepID=UPI001E370FDD|nr:sulfotransferase domain-containing protein [Rhodopirellula sp. JC737]MCC9654433.1 sulfotransferase [Rhodopirellula sp. JC737]
MKPNFIIGGVPKSGTTALANYLRTHPQIYFSFVKEPFYWASDMPGLRSSEGIETTQAYESLFQAATDEHAVVGEGSTLYLYSDCAVPDSLAYNPSMRYLFMLRRPDEVAHAYHMQMCFHEAENEPDFEKAWRMQESRRSNPASIAARCKSPRLLQYASVAALGTQLERALAVIPPAQVHVLLFDDFAQDPKAEYERVLSFLELPSDGRSEFPKDNAAMKSNSVVVTRMLRSKPVRNVTMFLKSRLSGAFYRYARAAKHKLMFRPSKREPVSREFSRELVEHFAPEVEKVERLLGRDLNHWKLPKDQA